MNKQVKKIEPGTVLSYKHLKDWEEMPRVAGQREDEKVYVRKT
jgi:hypothetical protein